MKRLIFLLLILNTSLWADSSKNSTRSLLKQRLELYKALNKAKAQWQDEELAYQERLSIKKSQLSFLKKSIKEKELQQQESSQFLSTKEQDLKLSQEKLEALHQALDQVQASLLKSVEQLPKALQDLLPIVEDVKKASLKRQALQLNSRLQILKSLAKEISQLQKTTHVVEQILELNGKKQETQVLYLGTALAYYLSRDGQLAGQIIYRDKEWQIFPKNEIAPNIQKALNVLQQEGKPELIQLPIPAFEKGAEL